MAKSVEIEVTTPAEVSDVAALQATARPRDGSVPRSNTRDPLKPDPLLGTTLNNSYVVNRLIGEGGMGRVYEARHTRIAKKRFAVKVLRTELAGSPEVLARFQREAETAASISHPSVIGVYDVDRTADGIPYLVCEYLEGIELADYLDTVGKLESVTAVHICYEICKALEAAHASGVIHRDLKPQNVFLVGRFEDGIPLRPIIKVLDFGLSRFQDSGGNSLTRTGAVMGTPSFMAPEQARGQKTDHRTDIYGVGAILYTLLTGCPPFGEETTHATVFAVMERDPPRPRSIEPSISQHLELIVQRAMAKEPVDRYADVTALKLALDLFAAPAGTSLLPPAPVPAASRLLKAESAEVETARPRLLLTMVFAVVLVAALLAMALVAVGVLTGWLTFRPVELALLLAGALGTSVTPGVILIRRIRRVVWNNTARVLDTLKNLRAPLVSGLFAYGATTLVVRFGDVVLARFTDARLFGHPSGIGWPGWDLVFPVVGALAAGTLWLRRLSLAHTSGPGRRALGAVIYATGLLTAAAVVYGGLVWRAASQLTPVVPMVTTAATAADAPTPALPPSVIPEVTVPSTRSDVVPPKRVTDDELAAAIAAGVEGLVPLANKYPADPEVLKPLVFAFASRSTGHVDAMTVAKKLLQVAPDRADDSDLRLLVSKVAETSKNGSQAALLLMASSMGSVGPDLLYDLMLSRGAVSVEANRLLAEPAVQARFSPALKVAFELRKAKTCADRLPLLERAASLGDERSLIILDALSRAGKKSCGKWHNQRCPAQCPNEAQQYRGAVAKISLRMRGLQ